MRRILIAAAALLMSGGAGLAADDVMAGFYGNTVISTGNGIESRTHFRADHSFDANFKQGAQSFASKGTWKADTGQVCRVYDPVPPGFTNPVCIPAEPHKVGDHWKVTVNGGTRDVTLVAGIQ